MRRSLQGLEKRQLAVEYGEERGYIYVISEL